MLFELYHNNNNDLRRAIWSFETPPNSPRLLVGPTTGRAGPDAGPFGPGLFEIRDRIRRNCAILKSPFLLYAYRIHAFEHIFRPTLDRKTCTK